jgi:hypothetical protein
VGIAKLAGDGMAKDVKGGIALLDSACSRGEAKGCQALAALYQRGDGGEVPVDLSRERSYQKKACDLGAKESCGVGGSRRAEDLSESTLARFKGQWQAQCEAGVLESCAKLGR